MEKSVTDDFFRLVRYAVNGQEDAPLIDANNWSVLFNMAFEQSLIGVLFQGVNRLPLEAHPSLELKLTWYAHAELIAQQNKKVDEVAVRLAEQVEADGFSYAILKGQGNAVMYPNPSMRTPGDIDIWLMAAPRRVINYVQRKYDAGMFCYHHIDAGMMNDIEIEVHYRPSFMNNLIHNRRLQRWFQRQAASQSFQRVELPGQAGSINVPDDGFNRIFQMAHISNHLIHEGIGLRQLIDYYYLLNRGFTPEEQQRDEQLLRSTGLYTIAASVMHVLGVILRLPREKMIVAPDVHRGTFLLQEVLEAGNFGKFDKRYEHSENPWKKNIQRLRRDVRLLRYFPSECIWEPLFRWYHFFWRLAHRG
jgi:hypothetical protein